MALYLHNPGISFYRRKLRSLRVIAWCPTSLHQHHWLPNALQLQRCQNQKTLLAVHLPVVQKYGFFSQPLTPDASLSVQLGCDSRRSSVGSQERT